MEQREVEEEKVEAVEEGVVVVGRRLLVKADARPTSRLPIALRHTLCTGGIPQSPDFPAAIVKAANCFWIA